MDRTQIETDMSDYAVRLSGTETGRTVRVYVRPILSSTTYKDNPVGASEELRGRRNTLRNTVALSYFQSRLVGETSLWGCLLAFAKRLQCPEIVYGIHPPADM